MRINLMQQGKERSIKTSDRKKEERNIQGERSRQGE